MRIKFLKYFNFISFFYFSSCTPLEAFKVVNDFIESTERCSSKLFISDYQEQGLYLDKDNIPYKVLVDYEDINDRFKDLKNELSSKDIAQIASIAIDTYRENKAESVDDIYQYEMRNFHVIVATTDDEFSYLYNSKNYFKDYSKNLKESKRVLAFVNVDKFCWDPAKVNFTIIIRKQCLKPDILAHELGHVFSFYEYGDADPDHDDPRVWYELTKFHSMNGKVIWNYEKITGKNAVIGGPVKP